VRLRKRSTKPDDPRVAAFADELAAARGGVPPSLVWSGDLPSDGDEHAAATALVRERWWEFNGEGRLEELEEHDARELLTWVIGHRLEDDAEVLPVDRARELAAKFASLLPERRRWFGNDWDGPPFPSPQFDADEYAQTDWGEVAETLRSHLAHAPPEWFDAARLEQAARETLDRYAREGIEPASGVRSWHGLTDHVWDTGLIAVGEGRAWIAWFTDDD
jgi:hypothetical protein